MASSGWSEPAARRSRAWSGSPSSSKPLTAGLNTATWAPAAVSDRAITAATTVLPTSVPVPVTKKPRTHLCRAQQARCRGDPLFRPPWDDVQLLSCLPDHARRRAQLVGSVVGHHRKSQPRGSLGHRRRPDPLRENPAFERPLTQRHRPPRLSDYDRNDLRARGADFQPIIGQGVTQDRAVPPQVLDQARLAVEDAERGERRADRRRGEGCGEDEPAGGVDEEIA